MIRSNVALQEAMESGRVVIEPRPLPLRPTPGQKCPYDTRSVNLTLGPEISVPELARTVAGHFLRLLGWYTYSRELKPTVS